MDQKRNDPNSKRRKQRNHFIRYSLSHSGLQALKRFAPRWRPLYFVMDDSSIEANAVHDAFGGINQGEMAVKVFLCKVHSMLLRHLGNNPNCRKLLLQAMHARTSFKCETLINQAISINRNGKKQYIRKRWNLERSRMWATWSRTHSPILLQVTSRKLP